MRVATSAVIESCSTHGRVASAARTRSGQPMGQDISGILSLTAGRFEAASARGWPALGRSLSALVRGWPRPFAVGSLPHPIRASPITSSGVVRNATLILINLLGGLQAALVCTKGSAFPRKQARQLQFKHPAADRTRCRPITERVERRDESLAGPPALRSRRKDEGQTDWG